MLFIDILNDHFSYPKKNIENSRNNFFINFLEKWCVSSKKNNSVLFIGNIGIGKIALITKIIKKKNIKTPCLLIDILSILNFRLVEVCHHLDYFRASTCFNCYDKNFLIMGNIKSVFISCVSINKNHYPMHLQYVCIIKYKKTPILIFLNLLDIIFMMIREDIKKKYLTIKFSLNSNYYIIFLSKPNISNSIVTIQQNPFLLYNYSYYSTILDLDNSIFQFINKNFKNKISKKAEFVQIRNFLKFKVNKLINYYCKKRLVNLSSGIIFLEWNYFLENVFFHAFINVRTFLFTPSYLIVTAFLNYKNAYTKLNLNKKIQENFSYFFLFQNVFENYIKYFIFVFKILKLKQPIICIVLLFRFFINSCIKIKKVQNFIYNYINSNDYKYLGLFSIIKIFVILRYIIKI